MPSSSTAIEMRLEGVDKTKGVFAAAADRINKLARTVDATSARLARAGRVSSGAFSFRGFSATAHAVRNGPLPQCRLDDLHLTRDGPTQADAPDQESEADERREADRHPDAHGRPERRLGEHLEIVRRKQHDGHADAGV